MYLFFFNTACYAAASAIFRYLDTTAPGETLPCEKA